jgi:hypothetical protein
MKNFRDYHEQKFKDNYNDHINQVDAQRQKYEDIVKN